ncbi:MAG: class I SAM-dependent methyltransferase [Tenericutes bacterium]|jgi:tRNA (adenine22-N1)-methyltransferase|nr:class I SAM-dependent methyltransferase [Mycoplasmatota bacterium]
MISDRLRVASQFLKGYHYLADCGTDHALLPIYAIEKGFIKKAIASDNKHHPLLSAKKNINDHRLYGEIKTALADGLSYLNLENDVDVVTVLGMGGSLIVEILSKAYLYNVKRMVLQPNSQSKEVRKYLEDHKWEIVDEVFLKENDKYYQIIVCEQGKMTLSELEREFGPVILEQKSDIFKERIQLMIDQLSVAIKQTNNNKTLEKLNQRILFLKEAIK